MASIALASSGVTCVSSTRSLKMQRSRRCGIHHVHSFHSICVEGPICHVRSKLLAVRIRNQMAYEDVISVTCINLLFLERAINKFVIFAFQECPQCNKSELDSGRTSCRAQVIMMPIGTPKVPYRTPGEGTWQFVFLWMFHSACWKQYGERIIFIGQYIDEEFGNQLLATMLYLDSVDSSKNLNLYLNSPDGDLTPSMAIYDTMESIKSRIGTMALGYAYNISGFLLAAGAKGFRTAMPLTRIALQAPAGAAGGKADDIQNEAKELLRVRDYLFSQLAIKTGQPVEMIAKDLGRLKRFSSQVALEYGLIDNILRPSRIKADASSKQKAGSGIG